MEIKSIRFPVNPETKNTIAVIKRIVIIESVLRLILFLRIMKILEKNMHESVQGKEIINVQNKSSFVFVGDIVSMVFMIATAPFLALFISARVIKLTMIFMVFKHPMRIR